MKKMKKVLALITVATLLFALAIPALATDFDFESALKDFEPTVFNSKELRIGETHKPQAAIWLEGGGIAKAYSSDETIVTVDQTGTVTAVGEGTAYIAIKAVQMYEIYRYDVIAEGAQTGSETYKVPMEDFMEDLIENQNGHNETKHDSNNILATLLAPLVALIPGLAGVVGVGITGVLALLINFIALCFVGIILIFVIYCFVCMLILSKKSNEKKELPESKITENTVKVGIPDLEVCPKCGKAFGEEEFCSACGVSKKVKSKYVVPIKGRMTAQKFEKTVNEWLAENPYIYGCKINMEKANSLFSPLVNYKFFVKSATIEYYVSEKPQKRQYGFAFLYRFRLFGPIGYSEEKHVEEWKANNPDANVITTSGGRIQHFGTRSGFYAQYYNYVLFRK